MIVKMLKLGRLHFVMGGFLLFAFGALLAAVNGFPIDAPRLALGYLAVFCAHLSVSYSNDYFDYEADGHVTPTPFSGGSGILRENPELRPVARKMALGLIAASLLGAWVFVLYFDFTYWFLAFILAGNFLGWFYTAPPLRLSYRGLGEPATIFTLGFLLPGTGYFIVAGTLDWLFMAFSAVFLVYGMYFMLNVQFPDMEGDAVSGKRTLIVRMGRRAGAGLSVFVSALAVLGFFLVLARGFGQVDALWTLLLSFIPLASAIFTYRGFVSKSIGPSAVTSANVTSLILFVLLIDLCLMANL